MEALKAAIPEKLKQLITNSTVHTLRDTCSSLHHFFLHFEPFHQIVAELADPSHALCGKSKETALKYKQLGNQCFSSADYAKALDYYTQALRRAPFEVGAIENNLIATLYINRATVLHKMNLLVECLRDCNRALQICPSYSKAWYRRGKANVSLGNNRDAICDLNIAKSVESSTGGKKQIESEVKIILDQSTSANISVKPRQKENSLNTVGEMPQIKLQSVSMPDKGRGTVPSYDVSPGSLVHAEEPYATIILKQCRETHCHYCLNDLPADRVPCISCSIPLYCSRQCQIKAGGQTFRISTDDNILKNLPCDLGEYAAEVIQYNDYELKIDDVTEHQHECQGVHWPAVLPSEIVLAGRVLAKFLSKSSSGDITIFVEKLELSHCYECMPFESKLDSHIYAIVLLYCLKHSYGTMFSIDGISISQVVIVISQIKVNCMTVVRLKSIDAHGLSDQCGGFPFHSSVHLTSNVEQVRVGKAIYKAGSLFNHSCQPNVHAYFLSRTLYLRTTKVVAAGSQLELSYGPQVGLWDCKDRQSFLQDEYGFHCQCTGCSEVNLSDIVLNAFRCIYPNCSGAVLENRVLECEKQKIEHFPIADKDIKNDDIYEVCLHAFNQNDAFNHIQPGNCLKCGSYCDLKSSRATVDKALICIKRLQDAILSKEISNTSISDALRSLHLLRSNLHAYNKVIAEAEDNLAQAFCLVGGKNDGYDAVFISPHKFLGGPDSPGVLLMNKALYQLRSAPPSTCGGGTVTYVNGFNEKDTLYMENIEERENGGTPPIIQTVRAALAFWVKEYIGYKEIEKREHIYITKALKRLVSNPNIKILGNLHAKRQAILSFLIYSTTNSCLSTDRNCQEQESELNLWQEMGNQRGKPLHGPFVAALLNDLFGIQARGGCACAGPYGHELLNINKSQSLAIRSAVQQGYIGVKPGWTRVSFPYYMSEEDFEYILSAIEFLALYGQRFLPLYTFNLRNGSWRMKTEKFEALHKEENCNISNHLLGNNLEEVNTNVGVKQQDVVVRRSQSYFDMAKYIANSLPKFPPQGILQEDIDYDTLYFRV